MVVTDGRSPELGSNLVGLFQVKVRKMACRSYSFEDSVYEFDPTFEISKLPQALQLQFSVYVYQSPPNNLKNAQQDFLETKRLDPLFHKKHAHLHSFRPFGERDYKVMKALLSSNHKLIFGNQGMKTVHVLQKNSRYKC